MTDPAETRRALDIVRIVALADFLLLLALFYVAFVDRSDSAVSILGPIHGLGFIAQLYLVAKGAGEERWGWWFPAIVVVTGGPPGALIGDLRVRRALPPDLGPVSERRPASSEAGDARSARRTSR